MKNFFTKEVRIALVVILAIVVIFTGMNFLKGVLVFSDTYSYKVNMNNIAGLAKSTPVMANGFKVGTVSDITFDYDHPENGIVVVIDIEKKLHIPTGSVAEIDSDLMGNMKLNIVLNKESKDFIEPNGAIQGRINDGAMGELKSMIPTIQNMMPKLDSILTSVNNLLADPAIAAMLHNAETTTSNLATTTAQLNTLMGEMNRQVPGILKKADGTMAHTETLTSNLAQLDVAGTMATVNATLQNCKELTDKLNSSEGTIGKFMNDPSVYNNLNATMRDADSLMIDLKAHPKRYVHFSIFGKKDK